MTGLEYEKSIVALACWREMRGQGLQGMLSVVFVLRNRAKAGWFGGDIYQNAIALNQLSSMSVKGDPNTVKYPDPRDPQFLGLLQAIDGVFDDLMPDNITNGALYYAVLDDSTSKWFLDNIAGKPEDHPRVAVIGRTTFFK